LPADRIGRTAEMLADSGGFPAVSELLKAGAEEQVGLGFVGLWGLGLRIWGAKEQVGLRSVGFVGFRIWSFWS